MARGRGFEPRFTASKAAVLPLDDPRMRLQDTTNSSWIQEDSVLVNVMSWPHAALISSPIVRRFVTVTP